MATYTEILERLRAKYYEAIESPKPSYKIGEHSVNYSEYLSGLAQQIRLFEDLQQGDEITEEQTYGI